MFSFIPLSLYCLATYSTEGHNKTYVQEKKKKVFNSTEPGLELST